MKVGNSRLALPEAKGRKPEVLAYVGKEVIMGIRPECLHDEDIFLSQFPDSTVEVKCEVVERMGSETYLYLVWEGNQVTARVSSRSTVRTGDVVKIAIDSKRIHLFDKDTEKTITN